MSDELKMRHGQPGDPMFEATIEAVEAMRAATLFTLQRFDDPRDALTVLLTAASMFSGANAGTLMAMGAFTRQDTRRVVEAASRNFREGMKVGEARAFRVAGEQAGFGHA